MPLQQWTEQTPSSSDVLACQRAHQLDIWWAHYGEGKADEQLLEVAPVCTHVDSAVRRVLLSDGIPPYSISPGLVTIESDGDPISVEFDRLSPQSLAMAIVKAGILAFLPARSENLDHSSSTGTADEDGKEAEG
tara:strand:+ start:113443 stop:113844 length:402 start_codon:yes stop_codon:yes gene_type:complete